jgi:type I restriction enzyme S subunit
MKKYETFKDSGAEWIGKIPESWKSVNLKWISNITKGRKPKVDHDENGENLLPYLSMEFLRGKTANPTYASIEEKGLVHIDDEDILILWDGSKAGEIVKAKKGILSSTMAKIEINDNNFESNYLNYLLQLGERYVQEHTIGMGIPHVSGDVLKMLPMLVPSPQEQTQIAVYLDYKTGLIDTIIAQKEDLIKKLKEQRQAIINEAVTKGLNPNVKLKNSGIEWLGEIPEHWELAKLKWLSNIFSGGTPSTNIESYWTNGTIPWLNSGTVNQKRITEPSAYITDEALQNSSTKWVYKGSILMALAGQGKTKGMAGMLEFDATCNQSMAAIEIVETKAYNEFILIWLECNYLNIRSMGGGEKRDGINLQILGNIYCPLPSIKEQKEISKQVNNLTSKIDISTNELKRSIDKLKEYRQSLISEAVTGKVDVRDWKSPKH